MKSPCHAGVIIAEEWELPSSMLVGCEAAMLSQFRSQTARKPGALALGLLGVDFPKSRKLVILLALNFT